MLRDRRSWSDRRVQSGGVAGRSWQWPFIAALLSPAAANATITSVFEGTVACTEQTKGAEIGQRWCGNSANTTVPSWDGTPIDVVGGLPARHGRGQRLPGRGHLPRLGRHEDHALEPDRPALAETRLRRLQHVRPRLGLLLRRAFDANSRRRPANSATST